MSSIIVGNLEEERAKNPKRRGWFIGHFIEPDSVFKNNDFEVRWGVHKKGPERAIPAMHKKAKTISILVKGRFAIRFPKKNKEVILSKVGDFVFFDAKIYHTSEALTDSIILTIRWPSISGNQKTLSK